MVAMSTSYIHCIITYDNAGRGEKNITEKLVCDQFSNFYQTREEWEYYRIILLILLGEK